MWFVSLSKHNGSRNGRLELLDVVLPIPEQPRFIREALEAGLAVVPLARGHP